MVELARIYTNNEKKPVSYNVILYRAVILNISKWNNSLKPRVSRDQRAVLLVGMIRQIQRLSFYHEQKSTDGYRRIPVSAQM